MRGLTQRAVLLAAVLVALSTMYFSFSPWMFFALAGAWSDLLPGYDLSETGAWVSFFLLPVVLSFGMSASVGLATRAERRFWPVALAVSVLAPAAGFAFYVLLTFGPCALVACRASLKP